MTDYFRWVARQFYLMVFWPTRFRRDVEGGGEGQARMTCRRRLTYMVKLLPWIALVAVLANLLVGCVADFCEWGAVNHLVGGVGRWGYDWDKSWAGVAFSVAFGVALGVAFRLAGGVALHDAAGGARGATRGVASGVAFVLAFGVTGAVASLVADLFSPVGRWLSHREMLLGSIADGTVGPFAFALAFGVAVLVAGAFAASVAGVVAFGVSVGVGIGVMFAVTQESGVASSVAFGGTVLLSFYVGYFRLGSYPLDVLLVWLTHRAGCVQPAAAFRWWRRCPVAWNEVIYLPLPGADRLLALAN